MAQPVSGNNYKRVNGTAAGTTVISATPAVLQGIWFNQNQTGTLSVYDSATAAGTTATNLMMTLNNNVGTLPSGIWPAIQTKNGITIVVGGTTDTLVTWSA